MKLANILRALCVMSIAGMSLTAQRDRVKQPNTGLAPRPTTTQAEIINGKYDCVETITKVKKTETKVGKVKFSARIKNTGTSKDSFSGTYVVTFAKCVKWSGPPPLRRCEKWEPGQAKSFNVGPFTINAGQTADYSRTFIQDDPSAATGWAVFRSELRITEKGRSVPVSKSFGEFDELKCNPPAKIIP